MAEYNTYIVYAQDLAMLSASYCRTVDAKT